MLDYCKPCENCEEIACVKVCKPVPVCIEQLKIQTGRNAEAMVLNIKGRTKRVYRFLDVTGGDGVFEFDMSKLPIGYLSQYTLNYQFWFVDLDGDLITFQYDGKPVQCLSFEVENVLMVKDAEHGVNDFNYLIN